MGGIETFLLALARRVGRHDHEHALSFDDVLARRLRDEGSVVHIVGRVRVRYPWTVHRARRRLGEALERGGHEVVVAHGAWPYGIARRPARARRRALCLFAHGPPVTGLLERWALRSRPDLLIANSSFTAEQFRSRWPAPGDGLPTAVVHPVPLPRAGLDPAERQALRASLGAAPGEVVVACVGRLDPCKGHDDLLTALSLLPAEPPWRAWIVGGAQSQAEAAVQDRLLARSATGNLQGRVRLLGAREDAAQVLEAADVYCQPNVSPDSFGLTFVEAMQAGLPVITSAIGGALEVVGHEVGVLLPPSNPALLARELRALIHDPDRRARLGALGRDRALAFSDPARSLARLEEALDRAVACAGAGP